MLANTLLVSALALPLAVLADSHVKALQPHKRSFNSRRSWGEATFTNETGLVKRESGEFTWFVTGLGACGQTNSPADFVSFVLLLGTAFD